MATINWNEKKEHVSPVVETTPQESIAILQTELNAQKGYIVYLESVMLDLADIVFMNM